MTGSDCAVMCNLINTGTRTHPQGSGFTDSTPCAEISPSGSCSSRSTFSIAGSEWPSFPRNRSFVRGYQAGQRNHADIDIGMKCTAGAQGHGSGEHVVM